MQSERSCTANRLQCMLSGWTAEAETKTRQMRSRTLLKNSANEYVKSCGQQEEFHKLTETYTYPRGKSVKL